jgi:hypothetical protein
MPQAGFKPANQRTSAQGLRTRGHWIGRHWPIGRGNFNLLLIRTNLGCGTVLMAACASQGCSAGDLFVFLLIMRSCGMLGTR